jgi:hypothetical protein
VFRVISAVIVVVVLLGAVWITRNPYPQNTGIFPQVISCVQENSRHEPYNPDWQPPLRVKVEPLRDPGRVREYHAFGCTFYYYFRYFR